MWEETRGPGGGIRKLDSSQGKGWKTARTEERGQEFRRYSIRRRAR